MTIGTDPALQARHLNREELLPGPRHGRYERSHFWRVAEGHEHLEGIRSGSPDTMRQMALGVSVIPRSYRGARMYQDRPPAFRYS